MLRVENLTCFYGNVKVLKSISLHVLRGEIVAVLGSNGAGKTTLLRTIAGLNKPRSGEIVFKDTVITSHSPNKIVSMGMTLVPENRQLFSSMTVKENLELGGYTLEPDRRQSFMERVFALFPVLRERIDQPAGVLSGGEQQMLSIARALMTNPSFLMLDEPSMGLAPLIVQEIYDTLVSLNRESGLTLLIVEQDAPKILKIANRVYVIETGQLVYSGDPEGLTSTSMLENAYLGVRKE